MADLVALLWKRGRLPGRRQQHAGNRRGSAQLSTGGRHRPRRRRPPPLRFSSPMPCGIPSPFFFRFLSLYPLSLLSLLRAASPPTLVCPHIPTGRVVEEDPVHRRPPPSAFIHGKGTEIEASGREKSVKDQEGGGSWGYPPQAPSAPSDRSRSLSLGDAQDAGVNGRRNTATDVKPPHPKSWVLRLSIPRYGEAARAHDPETVPPVPPPGAAGARGKGGDAPVSTALLSPSRFAMPLSIEGERWNWGGGRAARELIPAAYFISRGGGEGGGVMHEKCRFKNCHRWTDPADGCFSAPPFRKPLFPLLAR